jgi:hypothetical protein
VRGAISSVRALELASLDDRKILYDHVPCMTILCFPSRSFSFVHFDFRK